MNKSLDQQNLKHGSKRKWHYRKKGSSFAFINKKNKPKYLKTLSLYSTVKELMKKGERK